MLFSSYKKSPRSGKSAAGAGEQIKSGTLVAEVPLSVVKTKAGAAYTAYKMHEVGDVVPHKQDIVDLLPKVKPCHQQHGQGDAAVKSRQGREHDQHKHDAGGPQQGTVGEQQALQHAGHKGREQDRAEQVFAAVLFFHRGGR